MELPLRHGDAFKRVLSEAIMLATGYRHLGPPSAPYGVLAVNMHEKIFEARKMAWDHFAESDYDHRVKIAELARRVFTEQVSEEKWIPDDGPEPGSILGEAQIGR